MMSTDAFTIPRDANFTEEQHALADVAGDMFASVNPPTRVRDLWDRPEPRDRSVWQQMAQMGLTSIGVPEVFGGMGGDACDLALVLERAGANLLPEALGATVAVAVPILQAAGGDVAATWLPRIAAGTATATTCFANEPYVLDIDEADLVIVEREKTLWLEGSFADATRVRSEDGSRRIFLRPGLRGQMLGGADLLAEARTRAAAATAAQLVGICDALLQQCVEYAKIRRQFDAAIGSFQAVQHMLADMFVAVESARGATRHAARQVARGAADSATSARIAKIAAARAHRQINADALQLFAGIGFTWEHDLHLWLKRGLALEAQDGNERHHRRLLADAFLQA